MEFREKRQFPGAAAAIAREFEFTGASENHRLPIGCQISGKRPQSLFGIGQRIVLVKKSCANGGKQRRHRFASAQFDIGRLTDEWQLASISGKGLRRTKLPQPLAAVPEQTINPFGIVLRKSHKASLSRPQEAASDFDTNAPLGLATIVSVQKNLFTARQSGAATAERANNPQIRWSAWRGCVLWLTDFPQ